LEPRQFVAGKRWGGKSRPFLLAERHGVHIKVGGGISTVKRLPACELSTASILPLRS
jgi:hypothetical protein